MRHNNNNQQVVDHYVTAILWALAITIILILLFNAENIADTVFSHQPLPYKCEVEGGC